MGLQGFRVKLWTKLMTPRVRHVWVAVSAAALIVTLADAMIQAGRRSDRGLVVLYTGVFLFAGALAVRFLPRGKLSAPPRRGRFQGVGQLEPSSAWPRAETEGIAALVNSAGAIPVVLVGDSGVGKSVIMRTQVIPHLTREGFSCGVFENYGELVSGSYSWLRNLGYSLDEKEFFSSGTFTQGAGAKPAVLVLDQFEQYLGGSRRYSATRSISAEWMRQFIKSLVSAPLARCVIVVRKEWYFDLKFLEDIVPSPRESFELTGIRPADNPAALAALSTELARFVGSREVVDVVQADLAGGGGQILPVEAQIVGLMIENRAASGWHVSAQDYHHRLGGKEGLIEEYFRGFLDPAPNRDIALRVLCALSIETRLKGQLTANRISAVTHTSAEEVRATLEYFRLHGIVVEGGTGAFHVAHDFLALKFHELSGAELEPVDRDNIVFFWDETRDGVPTKMSIPAVRDGFQLRFEEGLLLALCVVVGIRLTSPAFGWQYPVFLPTPPTPGYGWVDMIYLPIAIAHLGWFSYVVMFHQRFFAHIVESASAKRLGKATVIGSFLLVAGGTLVPTAWLVVIGLGGFLVGVKLVQLALTARMDSAVAYRFFGGTGLQTIVNVLIVTAVGIAETVYFATGNNALEGERTFLVSTYVIGMVMVYWLAIVWGDHVSPRAASMMLGLVDRPIVRRTDALSP